MLEERTNLYRVVAQTLLWIQGATSMRYEIQSSRITAVTNDDETHYPIEVITNRISTIAIQHPMGLVISGIHLVMTGSLVDLPEWVEFDDSGIMEIEIEQMPELFLKADNSGYNNIAVQTKAKLRESGNDQSLTRQFLFRDNMLYRIR